MSKDGMSKDERNVAYTPNANMADHSVVVRDES